MRIIECNLVNDLKVILIPVASAKTITGVFAVRAGAKYEGDYNNGLAHFLEHMTFKGTHKRPTALDIAKEVEGRGGDFNATTGKEWTKYYIGLPYMHKHLEIICDILSDMALNSKLDSEEIEKEKGVIIEELRRKHDNPSSFIWESWFKLLYGDQPVGRDILGTEESVKAIRRKHLTEFIENLYIGKNAVFCLAGKIGDPSKATSIIYDFFKGLNRGAPKIKKIEVIESQIKPALLLESRNIQQICLVLGVRAFNIFHPKLPALEILSNILGGNMCSRLWLEIREKRNLAYEVASYLDIETDTGSLCTYIGVNREKVFEATKVIIDEFKKLCDEKISSEELRRAKDCIIGSRQMLLESPLRLALQVAGDWTLKEKITSFKEECKLIKEITREDVQKVAQEILVNSGLNLAVIGPHRDTEEEFLKILKF